MDVLGLMLMFGAGAVLGGASGWEAARVARESRNRRLIRELHALRAAQDITLAAWRARKEMAQEAARIRRQQDS